MCPTIIFCCIALSSLIVVSLSSDVKRNTPGRPTQLRPAPRHEAQPDRLPSSIRDIVKAADPAAAVGIEIRQLAPSRPSQFDESEAIVATVQRTARAPHREHLELGRDGLNSRIDRHLLLHHGGRGPRVCPMAASCFRSATVPGLGRLATAQGRLLMQKRVSR